MTVYKKLMQARIALQGKALKKSGTNKFGGYSYFELGDFLPEIQTIFNDIGLCGVVSYDAEIASLTITDVEDGTSIIITSPMAEANLKGTHPIQNLGAVETYQRRYLWMTAMEIVEHDVLDATTGAPEKAAPKAPAAKPTGKPPAVAENNNDVGGWTLKVTAKEGTEIGVWAGLVLDSTLVMLETAKSKDDVMNIFKNNRNTFDTLKLEAEDTYKKLMDSFTKAKTSFEQEA
jgi:hypothetical protein